MKNQAEPLSIDDFRAMQRKLYNFVMEGLNDPEAPAVVVSTALKLVDSARLDPTDGSVSILQETIDQLPDEFKTNWKDRPDWKENG